ncbi:Glutathione gamma-glutamylcysteinyltransferase 3 [Diplonema papillatum]|nr:Glutathione gamma-glutamylcysteinyltransferase 3 [Diplonema papillatum]KAJ9463264.1 Glutathione gamma-glutamylcysteinyltransferase 3 [Diplonema papillatum]|eukprot:gene2983-4689_t
MAASAAGDAARADGVACQFRRPLPVPPALGSLSSAVGKQLFREALAAGHAEGFFGLSEQFRTQDKPAFCGLSTLVMALNTLQIDPGRVWSGCWRFFHEDMLNCCVSLDAAAKVGITLENFVCLALCNGARARVFRPKPESSDAPASSTSPTSESSPSRCCGAGKNGDNRTLHPYTACESNEDNEDTAGVALGLLPFRKVSIWTECPGVDQFRAEVIRACSADAGRHVLVVSYSRKQFAQTGDGHFSPLAAYHAGEDAVLIMDVARFKYPPHWVKVTELYAAMQRLDPDTGKARGYVILEPAFVNSTFVFLLRSNPRGWSSFRRYMEESARGMVQKSQSCRPEDCTTAETTVRHFVWSVPAAIIDNLTTYTLAFDVPYRPRDHELAMDQLLPELQALEEHAWVASALQSRLDRERGLAEAAGVGPKEQERRELLPTLLTAMVLAMPVFVFDHCSPGCGCPGPDGPASECGLQMARVQNVVGTCSELLQNEIIALRQQIAIMMAMGT